MCAHYPHEFDFRSSHGLACVTIDGDKLGRKGAIKGGYYDHSLSKISLNKQIQVGDHAA